MFRPLISRVSVRMIATVVALTVAAQAADAQVKPFEVKGRGPAPEGLSIFGADSPHSATGTATHLGKYTGNEGNAKVLTLDFTTGAGTFHGSFVFVAANGDRLVCTYGDTTNGAGQVGEFQLFPNPDGTVVVAFLAEFNPVPALCTGKFKNVTDGSFLVLAVSDPFPLAIDDDGFTPPFMYSWSGSGWLEFGKKK